MSTNNISSQIKMHSEALYRLWLNTKEDEASNANPKVLKEVYQQLSVTIESVDANKSELSKNELNKLVSHGIKLHMESINWIERLNAQPIVRDALKSLILFSAWAGRQGGELDEVEFIVNILGEYTNHAKNQTEIEELAQLSRNIIDAVPEGIKQDVEKTPWRVLLLNNAIVATRSNQNTLIEQAYQLIGQYLPKDAPDFFYQALKQMDTMNAPDNVRILARRYYELWNNTTLH